MTFYGRIRIVDWPMIGNERYLELYLSWVRRSAHLTSTNCCISCNAVLVSQKNSDFLSLLLAELGTRQFCRDKRDHVSRPQSCYLLQYYYIYLATQSRHLDLNIFQICSCPGGSSTLLHCRCREAKKLSLAQLWLLVNCGLMARAMWVEPGQNVSENLKQIIIAMSSSFACNYCFSCVTASKNWDFFLHDLRQELKCIWAVLWIRNFYLDPEPQHCI